MQKKKEICIINKHKKLTFCKNYANKIFSKFKITNISNILNQTEKHKQINIGAKMRINAIRNFNYKNVTDIQANVSTNNKNNTQTQSRTANFYKISFTGINNITPQFEYNYTEKELQDRLSPSKYTKIELLSPTSEAYRGLQQGDKEALNHLIKAADLFDNVYKRLDNIHNLEFENALYMDIAKGNKQAILTKKLYDGQKGIIGKTTGGQTVKLAKNIKELPGKGFFPEDLGEEEFHQILIKMIKEGKTEEVSKILNQRSVIFRDADELRAIDYTEFFKKEFLQAADELELAAKTSTNPDFNEYLLLQAQALRKNDPELDCLADKKWATLQDTPLEFTLGRECYSDKMTPTVVKNPELRALLEKYKIPVYAKDNVGVRVGIVNTEGTKYLLMIKKFLPYMAANMPFNNEYKQKISAGNSKQTMVDAHIVYATGQNGAYRGGISIASNLPNADKLAIQTGGGFRNVYNKELRSAKYASGVEKKLNLILDKSQHKYFSPEALHDFTILHENIHSLGPKEGLEMLGIYKNTIEECKADMGALTMLEALKKKGFYTPKRQKEMITSLVTAYAPLGKDLNDAHRTRNIMQQNYFIEHGGIKVNKNGKMKINFEKITECAQNMLEDIIRIQLSKNEKMAAAYINKYAVWTKELELVANNLRKADTRLNSYLSAPIAKAILRK